MEFITEWGMIAGFAGLALGTFFYLFREIISKKIFPKLTKKQSFTLLVLFMVLVWILSITSIILYYSYNQKTAQLTIFITDVHNNVVLENEGKINSSIGNSSLNTTIGENGRVNFSDIPIHYIGDTIKIGIDAENWEIADNSKVYIFSGEPIHVTVKQDVRLGIIKGVVRSRDGQQFIKNAIVKINSDTVIYSDTFGIFKILLPERMRIKDVNDSYMLTVSKKGYKTKTQYFVPKSTEAEIRLEKIN